jgi:branched-chain amino acid transport system ATP-binding protein
MMPEVTLEVEGLCAWYGASQALHGVTLNVRQGETVALLGRNGAGKTTTLRAITGALRSRRGKVIVNGIETSGIPVHHVARHGLAYVPEDRGIFPSLNVGENLMLPPAWSDRGFSTAEIFELFPNLRERLHSPAARLSGGEQQMLAMARVLRTGPRVLLLDEPTEGLAPVIVQRIGDIIRMLKQRGIAVLLVEQNFRFASRLADRYYVMEHGAISDQFDAGEIAQRSARIHELLGV